MHALPVQLTPLIGREREVAAVVSLLTGDRRILTLTGPGGAGKTRLGVQAATELAGTFEHGVSFVSLAAVRDAALVAPAIAGSLGLKEVAGEPPLETLKTSLRDKRMLLLVDNFEQVSAAAPQVGQLASAAPGVKMLVTSRVPLRIHGEYECPVPPLAHTDAVTLFLERARAINPGFSEDPAIAQICARLDGLPLAVELAAARTRMLPPRTLLERLTLDLLTLRETIAWSHNLLTPAEKDLFARLSVFVGGCSLAAAEAVCDADLDVLESLVANSLLRHDNGRFVMLETIGEFAREQLAHDDDVFRRHAEFFLAQAEIAKIDTHPLHPDQENVRAALNRTEGTELGVRLTEMCWRYWFHHGYLRQGEEWVRRAIPHVREGHADLFFGAGMFSSERQDSATARADFARALAADPDDDKLATSVFARLGDVAYSEGDYASARLQLGVAIAHARSLGVNIGVARVLGNLAEVERAAGDLDQALRLDEEALVLMDSEDPHLRITMRTNLAHIEHRRGDCERALDLATLALVEAAEIDFGQLAALCLLAFGGVAATLGAPRRAALLLGAADQALRDLGAHLWPADRIDREHYLMTAREQLPDFDKIYAEGRSMPLTSAIELALGRGETS